MDFATLVKIMAVLAEFINGLNNALDWVFLWGGLILTLAYPIYFFVSNINKYYKKNKSEELVSHTLILFALATVLGVLWCLPEIVLFWNVWLRNLATADLIRRQIELIWVFTVLRWIELALAFAFFAYNFGHEHGERRWINSCLGHIVIIFLGLVIDRWMGILFISLPIFLTYYAILYNMAMITVPTSAPEDRFERQKRFHILTSYTWGIQSPMIVVDGHAWKNPETRIPGDFTWDFSDFPFPIIEKLDWRPGLVWTKPHHVVAITNGTNFKRIDGPGVVFTRPLERAFQVFDLRNQLRTNEIDVVSKDGVSFKARVFTAFRLDPDAWDKETYIKLRRMNPVLRGADKPTYAKGSFHYSNLRVQAALGVTSTKAAADNSTIYWDQWALGAVEDQARKAISQKNLDELWRPLDDKKGANALDKIADEIKKNVNPILRSAGILVFASRIVNFRFPSNDNQTDEISRQQLASWGSEWERKRAQILSEAQAESEHAQQEARAYAESLLLNSIAEGLKKAHDIDAKLPRYVIAMRFLSSLQDYVHKQTDEKSMDELQNSLKQWREQFLTDYGKEK